MGEHKWLLHRQVSSFMAVFAVMQTKRQKHLCPVSSVMIPMQNVTITSITMVKDIPAVIMAAANITVTNSILEIIK